MLRCLSLTAEKDSQKIEDIRTYRAFIDAVEIRLDLCESKTPEMVGDLCAAASRPVILSYRRAEDTSAGKADEAGRISEQRRLEVLLQVLQPGISFVDVEYDAEADALLRRARELGIRRIRSIHDFAGVPADLAKIVSSIAAGGDIPKVACYPRSSEEALRLIKICRSLESVEQKIILGMGPFGFFTRTAPWLCGSMLTFVSAGERKAAPGHIGPQEIEEVYGVSHHGKNTRLFGIIGNPVMHTRSPHLHNPWFSERQMDAVYLPFRVDDVGVFMRMAEIIGIRGFSVTVPHKQSIIEYLDTHSEGVDRIGSCNTVVRTRHGWHGTNTDLEGFLSPLRDICRLKEIGRALVIGAGGAARTVVYSLRREGINVTIVNRTPEKAQALAQEMDADCGEIGDRSSDASYDLIVQTTSAGMSPRIEIDPLPDFRFRGSEIVYDIIYAPEKTLFLSRAEAAGCRIIGGAGMLRAQAELQFSQFSDSYNLLV